MPKSTERSLSASIAADTRWSRTPDRAAATAPARRALEEKFEREVDPEGILDPALRAKLAQNAKSAHYKRLALKSARARRKAKDLIAEADGADRELGGDVA